MVKGPKRTGVARGEHTEIEAKWGRDVKTMGTKERQGKIIELY